MKIDLLLPVGNFLLPHCFVWSQWRSMSLRCRKQSSFQARCAPQRSQSYRRDSGCGNRAASHALQMALERGHGPAPCRVYMSLLTNRSSRRRTYSLLASFE